MHRRCKKKTDEPHNSLKNENKRKFFSNLSIRMDKFVNFFLSHTCSVCVCVALIN